MMIKIPVVRMLMIVVTTSFPLPTYLPVVLACTCHCGSRINLIQYRKTSFKMREPKSQKDPMIKHTYFSLDYIFFCFSHNNNSRTKLYFCTTWYRWYKNNDCTNTSTTRSFIHIYIHIYILYIIHRKERKYLSKHHHPRTIEIQDRIENESTHKRRRRRWRREAESYIQNHRHH